MESWGKLIQGRHNRYVSKAQRYWIRLRGILFSETEAMKNVDFTYSNSIAWSSRKKCVTPSWAWKGAASVRPKLFDVFDGAHIEDSKELVKALDTFILTSPLGEFEERLKMLKTCADESATGLEMKTSWELHQCRILNSIWSYYNQYLPGLRQKLADLRAPVEEKLKNETKLAKWDTQSYYALAETTERNQRKLMKILSLFDESLNLNVGVIIQQESCSGLRSSIEAHDEFCATFPSFTSMFPMQGIMQKCQVKSKSSVRVLDEVVSVNDSVIHLADGHIGKIAKYANKMKKMSSRQSKEFVPSYVRAGGDAASSFCQAIFDRVESLRSNSTRPMKERALVDLFRELKENGFTANKWSTPSELKSIEQLFLLPTPAFNGETKDDTDGNLLGKGEDYYLRCITEVNALKSETIMLGSKYMSKREMDSMVNLAYSGMHILTQQRCLVSTLLIEDNNLKEFVLSTRNRKQSLPLFQSKLNELLRRYHEKRVFALESLNQLSLLLESGKTLITDAQNSWLRDSIAKLKAICSEPHEAAPKNSHFITREMCHEVERSTKQFIKAREIVQSIRRECEDLRSLPLDPFDKSLDSIDEALASALECNAWTESSGEHSPVIPSSSAQGFSDTPAARPTARPRTNRKRLLVVILILGLIVILAFGIVTSNL